MMVYIYPNAFRILALVFTPAPINLAVGALFLTIGVLLSRRFRWKGFFTLTFSIAIALSALAAAFNEGIDPGDGSPAGTFTGGVLLFLTYGCLGVIGFQCAKTFGRS
jgi:hypothetical protein